MIFDPITLSAEQLDAFTDEPYLSATQKWQILYDWHRFMLSGFKQPFFTPGLYRFLVGWNLLAHHNRERCWQTYFNADVTQLRQLLADLASSQPTALTAPAADLKGAMCRATELLYAPLSQVLQDLEYKHQEMITAWHQFALNSGIQDVTVPPTYTVSENTRNLLAYAAQIALTLGSQRPLSGLQLMFPLQQPALLSSVPVEIEPSVLNSGDPTP
jgi:hypothetical protein